MIFMLNRLAGGVNWQVPTFGSTGTSGLRPFDNGGGSAWSIAGGRVSTNEFLLDGVPNSTRGRYNFGPPVDAVEEFRIQTNTYDAQYGRTGGGVVNMTLKSGGNTFKGQAWDFLKNDVLNANELASPATALCGGSGRNLRYARPRTGSTTFVCRGGRRWTRRSPSDSRCRTACDSISAPKRSI